MQNNDRIISDKAPVFNLKKAFAALLFTGFFCGQSFAQTTINSVTPNTNYPGGEVVISGTDFNTSAEKNIVYFGATKATVKVASQNQLTVMVPAGAVYAPVSVLNTETKLTAYSRLSFLPTYSNRQPGTNNFNSPINRSTGESPRNIAIGDIDGDGKPDLAVVNTVGKTVSVFRNISEAGSLTETSFAQRVDFEVDESYGVVLKDLNGDGKLDMAVTSADKFKLNVFRNIGSPGSITENSFAPRKTFATGGYSVGLAAGDIDGDGKTDIVTSNFTYETISILRNISNSDSISFAEKVDFHLDGDRVSTVAIADLDGDNKPEILVGNQFGFGGGSVAVFRNRTEKGNISRSGFDVFELTVGSPECITVGDLNGDNKPEIIAGSFSAYSLIIFENNSTTGNLSKSSFAAPVSLKTSQGAVGVEIADMDGDGKPDVVAANSLSYTPINIFLNKNNAGTITENSFAPRADFAAELALEDLAVGDLDGDHQPDIIVAAENGNMLTILRNNQQNVSIKEVQSAAYFELYPNPAVQSFTIETKETGFLYFYSLEGKEITSFKVTGNTSHFSLPFDMNRGLYLCKFIGRSGASTTSKLLVK